MKKFVFAFEPRGKEYIMRSTSLETAKKTLEETFGQLPYMVAETFQKCLKKTTSQFEFELSQL